MLIIVPFLRKTEFSKTFTVNMACLTLFYIISDPFVKINFLVDGTRISKKRTHMKKRTLNPVYNESFVFDLPSTVVDLHNVCIEFCVFDHDRVTKNEVSLKCKLVK